MSCSQKQIEANRRNALNSTGPKTEQGKAISSKNATKHGLYSKDIIIDSPAYKENPEEYQQLLDSMYDELKPQTLFQESLVIKIANCLWRTRRAVVAETATISRKLDDVNFQMRDEFENQEFRKTLDGYDELPDFQVDDGDLFDKLVGERNLPDQDKLNKILYYEMRLNRQMTRAYKLLKSLQTYSLSESPQKILSDPNSDHIEPISFDDDL